MSLTKQDRIELSSKLAGIADEKAAINKSVEIVENAKIKAEAKDAPNRKIIEQKNVLINSYQNEIKLIDGLERTELTEDILVESAKRALGNSFFPNREDKPLPSVPSGIWLYFPPLSRTHAIGKNNLEFYSSVKDKTESTYIDKYEKNSQTGIIVDINAQIDIIEAQLIAERATGKIGQSTGTCSNTQYTTQATCVANGGTWTPGLDEFVFNPVVQNALTSLKSLVQDWEDILNQQKNILNSIKDTNSVRISQNLEAIQDIENAINIINEWQSVQDYDTNTPLPTTIHSFNSLTESYFEQSKLLPTSLQKLKDELSARSDYLEIRIQQISGNSYLGTVTQSLSDGALTPTSGLYSERMLFIDMRINTISGTLSEIVNLSNSRTAQDQIKKAADIAAQGISLIMKATKATAPGIDTPYMNFQDLSGFSVGDRVYIAADDQEELSGSIQEIFNNRAKLTFSIPKKYSMHNNTRIYKML